MSGLLLKIDGLEVEAEAGMTIVEAAKNAGISIPTLCHLDNLEPYGGCRICTVEVDINGWRKTVAACCYPVKENLTVITRSEKIDRIRKMILELLLAHAPHADQLRDLANEYGADPDRFEKEASFCIHCGLCVRYCAEVKQAHAVGFIDRGIRKEISFIPEIAAKECWNCKECFPLCPTEALQAAYMLSKALSPAPPSCDSCCK